MGDRHAMGQPSADAVVPEAVRRHLHLCILEHLVPPFTALTTRTRTCRGTRRLELPGQRLVNAYTESLMRLGAVCANERAVLQICRVESLCIDQSYPRLVHQLARSFTCPVAATRTFRPAS